MTAPDTCPFCKAAPAIHRSKREGNGTPYFVVECVSEACAMRIVKTHACGDEESAVKVWNTR